MESDFSIRKEVEAIQNESDQFNYMPPPESPFDEFIQNDSLFTNTGGQQASASPIHFSSNRLILQQQELIHHQQMFNLAMIREFARQRSEPWKYIAIIAICIVVYLAITKNTTYLPITRRRRRRNVTSSAFNKFDA